MRALLPAALLLAGVAHATDAPPLDPKTLAQKAEVIVQATVAEVSRQERDGETWTVYRLKVSEVVTGAVADLPKLGEDPALWVLEGLENAPTLKANDEAVLLLYRKLLDSPVVGGTQGLYRVVNGKVGVTDVAAFKKSLLDARGPR